MFWDKHLGEKDNLFSLIVVIIKNNFIKFPIICLLTWMELCSNQGEDLEQFDPLCLVSKNMIGTLKTNFSLG